MCLPLRAAKIKNKIKAGTFRGQKSTIPIQSELLILWGLAEKKGEQTIKIPENFNTMLYLIKGAMKINGYGIVDAESLLVFEKEGDAISMLFTEDSQFLVLSGQAIDESVSQYGPYVMNTQTEILEAIRDYQMGKMGILIESS